MKEIKLTPKAEADLETPVYKIQIVAAQLVAERFILAGNLKDYCL